MSVPIHRNTDSRSCGATTVVAGQVNVYANNLLVSVDRDPNSHGNGKLIAVNNKVYVNNKLVVNHTPDSANADNRCDDDGGNHCHPDTAEGSPNVFVGDDLDSDTRSNRALNAGDEEDVVSPGSGSAYIQKQIQAGNVNPEEVHEKVSETAKDETPPAPPPALTNDCSDIASITPFPTGDAIDGIALTANYTVGKLTRKPHVIFDNPLRAPAAGLSVEEIVCNLKLLTVNCIEPIRAKYTNAFITNTWRPPGSNSRSQHPKGQAADIQFRGVSKSDYFEIAQWIKDNVTYDQLLLEYKTTGSGLPWIHISFDKNGTRKQALTLLNDKTYSQGLTQLA